MGTSYRILVINPGSTSTKLGIYEDESPLFAETLRHSPAELAKYARVAEQYDFRFQALKAFLRVNQVALASLNAVVGRGGLMRPLESGTYLVSERMIADLRDPPDRAMRDREHASSLGAIMAYEVAQEAAREAVERQIPAFVVDPVVVDELESVARISGLPEIQRISLSHALNLKAIGRRAARDLGRLYATLNLVMAHLGGGISITAHRQGRMVDVNQALDGNGPFSPERAGGLPVGDLVRLCYSGRYTREQMLKKLVGQGGLVAHLGTSDAQDIEVRIERGDEYARLIYEAMAYQIAKEIGAMSVVLCGRVDAIVLTGGLAHSEMLVKWIRDQVSWIAPVLLYPGEDEMLTMAQGALRVLRGEEQAKVY